MHRYRIVHVYTEYGFYDDDPDGPDGRVTIETHIGDGPLGLLDALAVVNRVSGSIATIERTNDDSIVTVFTDSGRFNLVQVSE